MSTEPVFFEKQYLGRNTYGLSRRIVMMLFCFAAHYYGEELYNPTGLFLLVGFIILAASLLLLFVPLYTIRLQKDELQLKSLRKKVIHLPLHSIQSTEVADYSKYHFNNPVFNVLEGGEYKFYSEGKGALLLQLEGGPAFRIGCKQAERLAAEITKMKSGRG